MCPHKNYITFYFFRDPVYKMVLFGYNKCENMFTVISGQRRK